MQNSRKTLIFGRHPVLEAIEEGQSIEKVLLQQGTRGEFEKTIRQLCKTHTIPLQVVPKEKLNKFTRGNHQGIVGLLSSIRYYRLSDVLPMIYEQGEAPLILILDGITDVRNFGAIARSAVCCGVHTIVIPTKGVAQINSEAIKTSAGTLNKLPICREHSLVKAIEELQISGIQVVASNLQADSILSELDFNLPTAIVMGSEGEGVSKAVLSKVDQDFIIPQRDLTDSFNVSVASGIILYEAIRQRGI